MRLRNAATVATLLGPLTLVGCGVFGSAEPAASATPDPVGGPGWLVSTAGDATASPSATGGGGGSRAPLLPPVSFLPVDPGCTQGSAVEEPLIPMTIVPGKGSLKVTWPRQYDSNYRITAIPQPLVSGAQDAYIWKNVPASAGCTVTATITGLTSGKPYVVWLDAPNTGYQTDGTRHPYSGRSDVVFPT
jgi:hypothetical protein